MPDLRGTNFYQSLEAPFSEALKIAQVATDPHIEHRGEAYPPILTAADYAIRIATRTDNRVENLPASDQLTKHLYWHLLNWTREEFFELVPVTSEEPGIDAIGFQITPQGMRTAERHIRDHAVRLMNSADRLNHRLEDKVASTAVQN